MSFGEVGLPLTEVQPESGNSDVEIRQTEEAIGSGDPIDLMDMALTIAENVWLLVLVPVLVGAIAYGLASLLPETFESTAILQPAPSIPVQIGTDTVMPSPAVVANTLATTMTTATYLERAVRKITQTDDAPIGPTELQHRKPGDIVRATVGANDNLLVLTVSWHSPVGAQRLASALIALTLEESRPKSSELQRLTAERAYLEQKIGALTLTGERVKASMERDSANSQLDKLAKTYFLISENLVEMQRRVKEIDTRLEGITEASVLQQPTLPTQPVAPRKLIIALVSAIGTAFLLLIGIFVRQSWRVSGSSPQNIDRLLAMQRKYGLKK